MYIYAATHTQFAYVCPRTIIATHLQNNLFKVDISLSYGPEVCTTL